MKERAPQPLPLERSAEQHVATQVPGAILNWKFMGNNALEHAIDVRARGAQDANRDLRAATDP